MTNKRTPKLEQMKLNDLQALYAKMVGEATRSPNRTYLIRRITEASSKERPAPADGTQAPDPVTNGEASVDAGPLDTTLLAPLTETCSQPPEGQLTPLEIPMLQARYLEVVGRPTGSANRAYLLWKIREAQRGRVPVGPRQGRRSERSAIQVLPFRLRSELVTQLDEAWQRLGLRNRTELLRQALEAYLAQHGESDLAAQLASTAWGSVQTGASAQATPVDRRGS